MKPANVASLFALSGIAMAGWGVFEAFGAGFAAIAVGSVVGAIGILGSINAR